MMSHHKLVLLFLSLLAILEEGGLTEASMAQRRESEKLVSSLKNGFNIINWNRLSIEYRISATQEQDYYIKDILEDME